MIGPPQVCFSYFYAIWRLATGLVYALNDVLHLSAQNSFEAGGRGIGFSAGELSPMLIVDLHKASSASKEKTNLNGVIFS